MNPLFRYAVWGTSIEQVQPKGFALREPLDYVDCDQPFRVDVVVAYIARPYSAGKSFACDLVQKERVLDGPITDLVHSFPIPVPATGERPVGFCRPIELPPLPKGTYVLQLWDREGVLQDPAADPTCLAQHAFQALDRSRQSQPELS